MENNCPQCGAPVQADSATCRYCGAAIPKEQTAAPAAAAAPAAVAPTVPAAPAAPQPQVVYVQAPAQPQPIVQQVTQVIDPRLGWPIKSKIAAGILAMLLGGIGIHKFYLGQIGWGIVYLLFCWTGLPAIWAFIDGIIILCSETENFELKYKVRAS